MTYGIDIAIFVFDLLSRVLSPKDRVCQNNVSTKYFKFCK